MLLPRLLRCGNHFIRDPFWAARRAERRNFVNGSMMFGAGSGGFNPNGIPASGLFDGSTGQLSRTGVTATDARKGSMFFAVKWGRVGFVGTLRAGMNNGVTHAVYTRADNTLRFGNANLQHWLTTTRQFNDPSAWLIGLITWDTTQATASERVKLYVEDQRVDWSGTSPAQNGLISLGNSGSQWIGYWGSEIFTDNDSHYFSGNMTCAQVDGLALSPEIFGRRLPNGGWEVYRAAKIKLNIQAAGGFGNNGYLIEDTSSGVDVSGKNNHFLKTGNITQVTDTPTNNYCVWNPLDVNASAVPTFSEGGRRVSFVSPTYTGGATGTIIMPGAGRYQFEVTVNTVNTMIVGVINNTVALSGQNSLGATGRGYRSDGQKNIGGAFSAYGSSYAAGDVIGVEINYDADTITFYKNGVSQGIAGSLGTTYWKPAISANSASANNATLNCGQVSFAYPISGAEAPCTAKIPKPTILDPQKGFEAIAYAGNAINNRQISVGFQPDLVWVKARTNPTSAYYHRLTSVGLTQPNYLSTNSTDAQVSTNGHIVSLDVDGFTINGGTGINENNVPYIAWCFKKGAEYGLDIVAYTGDGVAGRKVPHSLGAVPKMHIVKCLSTAGTEWAVYHDNMAATPQNGFISLQATNAYGNSSTMWNNTAPSAEDITVGTHGYTNTSGRSYIGYILTSIPGYQHIGYYVGNGNTNGPFVWCGFKPRWLLIKRTDAAANWWVFDAVRNSFNPVSQYLAANTTDAEATSTTPAPFDFVANGFKLRAGTSWSSLNASGGNYIFWAIADEPTGGKGTPPATAR